MLDSRIYFYGGHSKVQYFYAFDRHNEKGHNYVTEKTRRTICGSFNLNYCFNVNSNWFALYCDLLNKTVT